MTTFVSSTPVLHVSDAVAAEAFYCGSLGFEKQFQYRNDPASRILLASVSNGVT